MLDMSANGISQLQIIDFHTHHVDRALPLTALVGVPPGQRPLWERISRSLADAGELIASIEESGFAGRVVSTPLEFLREPDGSLPADIMPRINDAAAALVSRHPDRLYGLATVDAYTGEAAARELERAVTELGLRGVFVESAKDDLLPDAAEARPTFAAAAELGVPVFLHPVPDPVLAGRFRACGRLGGRLARSAINSAALLALLEGSVFEECPGLLVVVTALALGGVLLAGAARDGSRLRKDTPAALRRHVYIDTTGLDPVAVRSAVDLLGADHVLLGTDWPVVRQASDHILATFAACGLDTAEQHKIAGTNALKLLAPAERVRPKRAEEVKNAANRIAAVTG